VPLVARVPDQAPDAVHEVAFVEVHESTEAWPLLTLAGAALKEAEAPGESGVLPPQAVSASAAPAVAIADASDFREKLFNGAFC
jgi:hypothetical protein